jgi:hypothetical protein
MACATFTVWWRLGAATSITIPHYRQAGIAAEEKVNHSKRPKPEQN